SEGSPRTGTNSLAGSRAILLGSLGSRTGVPGLERSTLPASVQSAPPESPPVAGGQTKSKSVANAPILAACFTMGAGFEAASGGERGSKGPHAPGWRMGVGFAPSPRQGSEGG